MPLFRRIEDKYGVDDPGYEPPSDDEDVRPPPKGSEESRGDRRSWSMPPRDETTSRPRGKSYLCGDITQDPHYIEGAVGAKSSLTVPLLVDEQVIGTFNVESPQVNGFNEDDLQFCEIFSRELASALHTLELLSAEKSATATKSIEAISRAQPRLPPSPWDE